jgi:hypothetical protein
MNPEFKKIYQRSHVSYSFSAFRKSLSELIQQEPKPRDSDVVFRYEAATVQFGKPQ